MRQVFCRSVVLAAILCGMSQPAPAGNPSSPPGSAAGASTAIGLFDTEESFRAHWQKSEGTVAYDPLSKSIRIDSARYVASGGTLVYDAPWEQLDFDLVLEKRTYTGKLSVQLDVGATRDRSKRESVDIGPGLNGAGKYHLAIAYSKDDKLSVSVDGRLAHAPIAVADPGPMERLQLLLRVSDFTIIRIGNVRIKAHPEPAPPPAPAAAVRPASVLPLLATGDDFTKHCRPISRNAQYDARSKSIIVRGTKPLEGFAGEFIYHARWEEFTFDMDIGPNQFFPNLPVSLGLEIGGRGPEAETIDLSPVVAKPGIYHLKLAVENGKTLSVWVNAKLARDPVALLKKEVVDKFDLTLQCSNDLQLGNVKIKAETE